MGKLVVIVNGHGGAGKDTLCGYFCKYYNGKIVSSITPAENAAKLIGWDGTKDDNGRKLLSDLKKFLDKYFDLSFRYLEEEYDKFVDGNESVLYVVIREPDDIDRFKRFVKESFGKVTTLLIRRKETNRIFGNSSDDEVENYAYDYIFDNDSPIEIAHNDFITMMKIMTDEVV